MKKLLVAFVAVVAVSFASCGGNTEATQNNSDTVDTPAVVEETVEETVTDSTDTVNVEASDSVVAE